TIAPMMIAAAESMRRLRNSRRCSLRGIRPSGFLGVRWRRAIRSCGGGVGSGARAGLVLRARVRLIRRGRLGGGARGALALLGGLACPVLLLHLTHLGLEDASGLADAAGGVRQLLEAEEQQDDQDDQEDLHGSQIGHDGPFFGADPSSVRPPPRPRTPVQRVYPASAPAACRATDSRNPCGSSTSAAPPRPSTNRRTRPS